MGIYIVLVWIVDVDADDWHLYFFDELSKLAIKLNFETLLFTAKLIVIANHICRT